MTAQRLDDARADFLSKPSDNDLHRVQLFLGFLVPDLSGQIGLADHVASIDCEVGQNAVFSRGELNRFPSARYGARAQIQFKIADLKLWIACPMGTSDQRLEPGKKLLGLERLSELVIGAHTQALYLIAPTVTRRKEQHGRILLPRTQPFENREPVQHGQPDV